ncbi:cytochrome c oxidase assembly protein [Nocardioides sp. NPDC057767]|uniref:Putative copper resistance protein D n=1 Tax=Nocardioides albertanoniae TaxID=1175486 RepID=A0A543A3Q1_9ACTN|nr:MULTISPECIES: bifunctional copper resistance protein CopD/cytochrome c oxidase assembly protein [Nocardioides]TQL67213.1 putative copper resistance protein D [Nocardioides albertanoniae]
MTRRALLIGLLTTPVLVTVALLSLTGAVASPTSGLPDPGALTRWGLPVARVVRDVAATVTIGSLVLAAVLLPGAGRRLLGAAQRRSQVVAAAAGSTWVVAGAIEIIFVQADVSGVSPWSGGWAPVWFFITQIDYGKALAASLVLAAAATTTAALVRSVTGIGFSTLLALAALWPLALTGHAAGDSDHDLGVNLQFLHLVPVTIWVGTLAALLVAGAAARTTSVISGFSRLAGWCAALVGLSGVLAAGIRVPAVADLLSTYGALLAIKAAVLGACLGIGWWHRRRLLASTPASFTGGRFARLAVGELALMGVAIGTGVALGRSAPPSGSGTEPAATPAEAILGQPMPPELTAQRWITEWRLDTFWGPVAVLAAVLYLLGVRRLHQRGVVWSRGRTVLWLLGCLVLLWATSGPPGTYGEVLFSMHMVQHMTIATLVPILLVLGSPVTLALRVLRRRTDGSRGAREWLLVIVHSWPVGLLGHPLVAAGLFIISLPTFYYSGLFELALSTHTGHLLMTAHFLLSGYLLANVVCGEDPGPRRPPYPLRVLLVMATFAFHAFFSISLMSSRKILAQEWYGGLGRTWGDTLAQDQYLGASLGWAMGDLPLALLAAALVAAWVRADGREARRLDRRAERDGDAARAAYNARLQALADRSPDGSDTGSGQRDV